MRLLIIDLIMLFLALWGGASAAETGKQKEGDSLQVADLSVGSQPCEIGTMNYRYFVPDLSSVEGKVPLVLFLHGLGDGGADNVSQLRHSESLIFVQPENQKTYPCFFIAPQLPKKQSWSSASDTPLPHLEAAVQIVKNLCAKYPSIDTDRLYITGISAGGRGAFDALAKYPDFFAAAVPISASLDTRMFDGSQTVAVWAFYTKTEKAYVRQGCDTLLRFVENRGGTVRKTVYPKGGHNAWQWAYNEPELIPWLFRQRRCTAQKVCDVPETPASPKLASTDN